MSNVLYLVTMRSWNPPTISRIVTTPTREVIRVNPVCTYGGPGKLIDVVARIWERKASAVGNFMRTHPWGRV